MRRAARITVGIIGMSLALGVIAGALVSVTGVRMGGRALMGWDAFLLFGAITAVGAMAFGFCSVLFVKVMDWMLDA